MDIVANEKLFSFFVTQDKVKDPLDSALVVVRVFPIGWEPLKKKNCVIAVDIIHLKPSKEIGKEGHLANNSTLQKRQMETNLEGINPISFKML